MRHEKSNCPYTSCISPAITAALTPPATGRVNTHARKMLLNSFQSTFCRDRAQPTNTTEPTLQWVVLIGKPRLDAVSTVIAAPSSMQKPLYNHSTTDDVSLQYQPPLVACHQKMTLAGHRRNRPTDWVVVLRPAWHKIGHFGDVHKDNHLAWYGRKIKLTTKACIHESKEMYYNTINTRKLKPDSVAYYDIQPGNAQGLFLFRRFINLSLTYLLRHLPTYSPGTHTGPTNDVLLPVTSYPTWSDDDMGWTAYQTRCKWRCRTIGENSTRLNKLKQ